MSKQFRVEEKEPIKAFGKTINFFKIGLSNNSSNISETDIKNLVKKAEKQYKDKGYENIKILILGNNGHKVRTLKGYDQDVDEIDAKKYYENHVKNPNKFTKFSEVQMTIQYNPPAKFLFSKK